MAERDIESIIRAFDKAHAAGDTDAAGQLAKIIRQAQEEGRVTSDQQAPKVQDGVEVGGVKLSPSEVKAIETAKAAGNTKQSDAIIARAVGRSSVEAGRGAKGLKGVGRNLETALLSGTQALFGAGDVAGAIGAELAEAATGRRGMTPRQNMQFVRGRREALEAENPFFSGAGTVAGAIAPGGLFAKGLSKLGAATGLSKIAPATTTLGKVAQGAGAGAAAGGIAGGIEGGLTEGVEGIAPRAVAGAKIGAALGGVIGGVGKGVSKITGAIMRRGKAVKNPGAGGFEALARKLGKSVSGDDLRRDFKSFEDITGRKPSIAELIDPATGKEINRLVTSASNQHKAQAVLRGAADDAALLRQRELPAAIVGGRTLGTAEKAIAKRGADFEEGFNKIRKTPVALDDDTVSFFSSPQIRSVAGKEFNLKLAHAAQDAADGAPAKNPIDLDDIDKLRRKLGKKAAGSIDSFDIKQLQEQVRDIGQGASSKYSNLIRKFAKDSDVIRGLERKGGAIRTSETTQFKSKFDAASGETQVGARTRALTDLADAAGESPAGAVRVARELGEGAGLQQRAATAFGGDEATRLTDIGQRQTRVADTFKALAPTNVSTAGQATDDLIKQVISGGAIGTKGSGAAFIASFVNDIVHRLQISPAAAEALAKDLTDPARTQAVIARMRAIGADDSMIQSIIKTAMAASNISSSGDPSE